jgi:uncharacterized protein (TIGR01244 family)
MTNNPCLDFTESQPNQMIEYTITEHIVLAGQPEPADWTPLVERGFRRIINIRSDPERGGVEGRNAEAAGLHYQHLPLPAYELEAEHMNTFHAVLAAAHGNKTLIHCRTASRTALLWMLHRVLHDGWSQEQAEAELRAAGYDEDAMDTFTFCAEDFYERTGVAPQPDAITQPTRG